MDQLSPSVSGQILKFIVPKKLLNNLFFTTYNKNIFIINAAYIEFRKLHGANNCLTKKIVDDIFFFC